MQDDTNIRANAQEILRTITMLKERMLRSFEQMPRTQAFPASAVDITFPQWNAMSVLEQLGEATIKELAERLQVSPPSASVMVDRLLDLNLVTREQRKRDRRTVEVRLSEAGAGALEAMNAEMLRDIERLMAKMGDKMTAQWCDVYACIRAIVEEELRDDVSGGSKKASV